MKTYFCTIGNMWIVVKAENAQLAVERGYLHLKNIEGYAEYMLKGDHYAIAIEDCINI